MTHKICTFCKENKPLDAYHVNKSNKTYGLKQYCKVCANETSAKYVAKNLARYMCYHAKARAAKRGLEFNLTPENITIPEICPILGICLERRKGKGSGGGNASPTLDRIDSSKGYTPENVWVISNLANFMKSSASVAELKQFARWVKETHGD